ncbi:MAG: gluconate 2-dehydrogenase subunit 3 family protein [Casimicrobiaceae bacterium]
MATGSLVFVGWSYRRYALAASNPATLPMQVGAERLTFFDPAESTFIDAAIARLIPADELGPGAVGAGVTLFIDHQLAGPFGHATDWYMSGPWSDGTEQQGYQRRRTPAEVYRAAIRAIDAHSKKSSGKSFAELAAGEQDDLLHALEDDKLQLGDAVSGKTFFTLLWQNTQEGFFADPVYLGNRNFAGWKLIGYPGPRYNYDSAIRHYGEAYPEPTVGLMGRDPSRQPKGPL